MTDLKPNPTQSNPPGDDPLSHLHKMSTTAGLGTTEYVAVNGMSIVALILGLASSLSLFANELLVLPIAAVVLGIWSLVQIKDSNGTQTGRILAFLGMFCALLFVGLVGGRLALQIIGNRSDEQAIAGVISQLDSNLRAKKFDDAYQLFGSKFQSRVKPQNFADTWRPLVEGTKDYSGLAGMRSNGRMEFETNPDTNLKAGVGMTIMTFGPKVPEARIAFYFSKNPDGTWKIADIPDLFKTQQGPQQQPQQAPR